MNIMGKFLKTAVFVLALILVVAAAYYYGSVEKARIADLDYNEIFALDHKQETTRLYVSKKLGIGFTYEPNPAEGIYVNVSETDDGVRINGQTVTVFSKLANMSLDEAIRRNFLTNSLSDECFIRGFDTGNSYPGYVVAAIGFPLSDVPEIRIFAADIWRENAAACPREYSLENGNAFFVMNPAVPDKFVFVKEGWNYSATSDGMPAWPEGKTAPNWTRSLRILW